MFNFPSSAGSAILAMMILHTEGTVPENFGLLEDGPKSSKKFGPLEDGPKCSQKFKNFGLIGNGPKSSEKFTTSNAAQHISKVQGKCCLSNSVSEEKRIYDSRD